MHLPTILQKSPQLVAVVGAGACNRQISDIAASVGHHLAQRGLILVCGGLGGVMAAACQGAKSAGGMTVGILPGTDPAAANPWVDVAIATGIGEARNAIIIHSAQAVIAVQGEYGTLSEIALALKLGKPVVGLQTWELIRQQQRDHAILEVATPLAAVEQIVRLLDLDQAG